MVPQNCHRHRKQPEPSHMVRGTLCGCLLGLSIFLSDLLLISLIQAIGQSTFARIKSMEIVVITGASGFPGRAYCAAFTSAGYSVYALVRKPAAHEPLRPAQGGIFEHTADGAQAVRSTGALWRSTVTDTVGR